MLGISERLVRRFRARFYYGSRWFLEFVRAHGCETWLVCLVAAYTILLSYLTIVRYLSLGASAYDLGIYNQAMHTAVKSGRFFYYTADLPSNPTGSIFGTHFLPVLFLVLPFYFIIPRVETLLVIQSFVLALGAVPIYLLGRRLTSKRLALFFSILYLASPLVVEANMADFHPEAFIPLGMLTAIYAMHSRRWGLYFVGIFLTLSSLEFAAVITGLYSLIIVIEKKSSIIASLKARTFFTPGLVSLFTLGLSIAWFALATIVIRVFNPGNVFLSGGLSTWSVLGADSLIMVPVKMLLDPYRALLALGYDLPRKVLFFVSIFSPFAVFLSLARKYVAMTIPWSVIALMSNFLPYYSLGNQYIVFYVPFLFAGGLYGLKKLSDLGVTSRKWLSRIYSTPILGYGVVILIAVSLAAASGGMSLTHGAPNILTINHHEQIAGSVVSMIPPEASVLTQPNLFPLVSNRLTAFLFPYQTVYPLGATFNATLDSFLKESDYVLLDTRSGTTADVFSIVWMTNLLKNSTTYGLYVAADGVLLFKKGYQGIPSYFLPITEIWSPHSLTLLSGTSVSDPESNDGHALHNAVGTQPSGSFLTGPDEFLPPGTYHVDFRVKNGNDNPDPLLKLEMVSSEQRFIVTEVTNQKTGHSLQFVPVRGPATVSASLSLYAQNFTSVNLYLHFALEFTLSGSSYVDINALILSAQASVYVDRIIVTQISAN